MGYEKESPIYRRIHDLVRKIPRGRVATYGQIARITGNCTARMVGYAMAALPRGTDVPWQRVINSQGRISERRRGDGAVSQRKILEAEGVRFDAKGKVDFDRAGWQGPAAFATRKRSRSRRGKRK